MPKACPEVRTMLIEFRVENYRSFAQEQTLSLVAGKDSSHPGHVLDCGKYGLLKAAAIYGANASGKSNLISAFLFMQAFVSKSATRMNLGDPIRGVEPFRLDNEWRAKPSSFEVRLLLDGTEYQYGFSVTVDRVHDEWLYVKRKGGRLTNRLLRQFDPETGTTSWSLQGELKPARELTGKTRDNGLFLSRAAEMNVTFVKQLFMWFRSGLWHFDLATPPVHLMQWTARRVCEDSSFRERVEALVHDADLGIDGISVTREEFPIPDEARKEVREELTRIGESIRIILGGDEGIPKGLEQFKVQARHRLADSGEIVDFSLEHNESNGTQRFFALVGPVLDALDNGALLVVDELECSMHPLLTFKLIELFQSPDVNPSGAQLVFATHDSTLMSPALLRRDQIYLTEKNRKGATVLFSLCDIDPGKRPRKQEALEKNYLSGRYGGVPNFGPAFEDLEVK